MKAICFYEYGGPEVLRYEDLPDPLLARDAVLIEAHATSVNPHDWKSRSGLLQQHWPLEFPHIPGFDVSGVVRAVGEDVHGFQIGDQVLTMATATYAELVAAPATTLTRLPDGIDPVDAAALPVVVLTGGRLVRETIQVTAGQTVLVTGALGNVGRAAVHAANKLGARVIAGVRTRQLGEAAGLQVAGTLAIDDEEAMARSERFDAVADTIGRDLAEPLMTMIRPGGRYGYTSRIPDGAAERHPDVVSVMRVFGQPDSAMLRSFAEDVRDGLFVIPITGRLPLREAGAAHARQSEKGGKIVLTMR
ncbi:MAG: NADP-dependent oxidoreductase [Novosphingobium sp.]